MGCCELLTIGFWRGREEDVVPVVGPELSYFIDCIDLIDRS